MGKRGVKNDASGQSPLRPRLGSGPGASGPVDGGLHQCTDVANSRPNGEAHSITDDSPNPGADGKAHSATRYNPNGNDLYNSGSYAGSYAYTHTDADRLSPADGNSDPYSHSDIHADSYAEGYARAHAHARPGHRCDG